MGFDSNIEDAVITTLSLQFKQNMKSPKKSILQKMLMTLLNS